MSDLEEARRLREAELQDRYGDVGLESGKRIQNGYFLRVVDELDQVDPDFTASWMRHIYQFMYGRQVLDDKTRILVIIGQCSAMGETYQLANHIRSALSVGASSPEILEVILHSSIYAGHPKMVSAMRAYRAVMNDLGEAQFTQSPFVDPDRSGDDRAPKGDRANRK